MTGLYEQFYELLKELIFGESVTQYVWAEFICQAGSAIACVLLIAIPFCIVWRVIRRLM